MSGQIITFYSYKGGVGRSFALANVAALLAQHGKKVLVIDFDLEAPGLHRYLLNLNTPFKKRRAENIQGKKGTIDFFTKIHENIEKVFPSQQEYTDFDELSKLIKGLLDSGEYINKINIKNPNKNQDNVTLDFIAAGTFTDKYSLNVYQFNWQSFYEEYGEIFTVIIEEVSERYDYILIDSRTGITDMASICTMILPEKLVLVFTPNEQSLHGALEIGRQAVEERKSSDDLRPLPLFPLMSRMAIHLSRDIFIRQKCNFFRITFENRTSLKSLNL
jgi:MinD-like ATPase involved in chromosome partitioning or flagellar assembly